MAHKAERGIFELRQGRVLCVKDVSPETSSVVAPVEGLGAASLAQLHALGGPLCLVVTSHRGRAMGLQPHDTADLALALDGTETPDVILALAAGGVQPSAARPAGATTPASRAESAGLSLARLGGLLPAVIAARVPSDHPLLAKWMQDATVLEVAAEEVEQAVASSPIEVTNVAGAPVPLAVAEDARLVFFREGGGLLEHVAVLIGPRESWPDPVPVRLHSACLTGDLFGSMRCDCGEQLRGSLAHMKNRGGGVLVYLAQEGRGIGLGNKIRAYTLQEAGLDTIDADEVLGFGDDERRYGAAVGILRHLAIERVELLTNNPQKVRALEEAGIQVVERTPIYGGINRHNLRYVQAKVHRSGHWLMDMIAQRAPAD
ncbi:MAG: GTP cyclohydrolase II [Gemmatimonadales bacterium]